jgi:Flp pilus assembly pilin Flp
MTRSRQRGAAAVEYLIVALFVVLVLVAGQDVIHKLADALRTAYASFLYTLSVSWL